MVLVTNISGSKADEALFTLASELYGRFAVTEARARGQEVVSSRLRCGFHRLQACFLGKASIPPEHSGRGSPDGTLTPHTTPTNTNAQASLYAGLVPQPGDHGHWTGSALTGGYSHIRLPRQLWVH